MKNLLTSLRAVLTCWKDSLTNWIVTNLESTSGLGYLWWRERHYLAFHSISCFGFFSRKHFLGLQNISATLAAYPESTLKGGGADGGGCKPIWVALYAEDVMLVALLDFPRNSTGGRKGGDPGITFCWIRPWTLLWVWARYPHVGDILLPETWLGRNIFRAIEKNMSWRNSCQVHCLSLMISQRVSFTLTLSSIKWLLLGWGRQRWIG